MSTIGEVIDLNVVKQVTIKSGSKIFIIDKSCRDCINVHPPFDEHGVATAYVKVTSYTAQEDTEFNGFEALIEILGDQSIPEPIPELALVYETDITEDNPW